MSTPLITVTAAARKLKMSVSNVRDLCRRHDIGTKVSGRLRVLSEADLARISAVRRPPGNPNWVKKQVAKKTGRKS
jgi:hypothetical protein